MLKYTSSFKVTEEDLHQGGNIRAGKLLLRFQEIAAAHAEALGIGFDELMADNRIWVMSKLRFRLYGLFKAGEEYVLETYPRPKRGVTFFRDYYVYDSDNNLLAAGISHWCVINFKSRRIEKTDIDFDGDYTDKVPFEDGIAKIRAGELLPASEHEVTEEDLDKNCHANNCRYADMVEDITKGKEYNDFTINFSKEALLGDRIKLSREETEGGYIAAGKLGDGTVIFQAETKM